MRLEDAVRAAVERMKKAHIATWGVPHSAELVPGGLWRHLADGRSLWCPPEGATLVCLGSDMGREEYWCVRTEDQDTYLRYTPSTNSPIGSDDLVVVSVDKVPDDLLAALAE